MESPSFDARVSALDEVTIERLGRLLDRLPAIEQAADLVDSLPPLVAIATDVFDEWAHTLADQGIDLDVSVRQGLWAVLWLGQRISNVDLERLGTLLHSDVLDQHAIEVVGMAGKSLAKCRRESCELPAPERVGYLGLMSALADPDIQRALGFAIRFFKCFGRAIESSQAGT